MRYVIRLQDARLLRDDNRSIIFFTELMGAIRWIERAYGMNRLDREVTIETMAPEQVMKLNMEGADVC